MMNMFLHDINVTTDNIKWTDTLKDPRLTTDSQTLMRFNVVVANPPFSLDKWGADNAAADRFNRFHRGVPPTSKGDYAFISHMIETTYLDPSQHGRVGVVVPHGVLFRGGAEGKIRQKLIEENLLDAVIGLPGNLFFGTGIPAALLIFRRDKQDDSVLFIDASRDYREGTNQNVLRDQDRERILETYRQRASIDGYAYVSTRVEIVENDYNLNISRYVDMYKSEESINIVAVGKEIESLQSQLDDLRIQMHSHLRELGLDE